MNDVVVHYRATRPFAFEIGVTAVGFRMRGAKWLICPIQRTNC